MMKNTSGAGSNGMDKAKRPLKKVKTLKGALDRKMTQAMNKDKYKEQQQKQHTLYLGTWNVRGTYSEGAIKNLTNEAKRYKLDIIALQETKQKGNDIVDMKEYIFFKSGGENRRLGTGFLINKRIAQEVLEFRPISDRICYIRIRGQQRKLSFINRGKRRRGKEQVLRKNRQRI